MMKITWLPYKYYSFCIYARILMANCCNLLFFFLSLLRPYNVDKKNTYKRFCYGGYNHWNLFLIFLMPKLGLWIRYSFILAVCSTSFASHQRTFQSFFVQRIKFHESSISYSNPTSLPFYPQCNVWFLTLTIIFHFILH